MIPHYTDQRGGKITVLVQSFSPVCVFLSQRETLWSALNTHTHRGSSGGRWLLTGTSRLRFSFYCPTWRKKAALIILLCVAPFPFAFPVFSLRQEEDQLQSEDQLLQEGSVNVSTVTVLLIVLSWRRKTECGQTFNLLMSLMRLDLQTQSVKKSQHTKASGGVSK